MGKRGLMPYLNVDEVETAVRVTAGPPNADFTQLIVLPHLTWEGRQCHAIKLGKGSGPSRIGVYLLGGVHAREWGSPDILVHFMEQLADAYRTHTGLTLSGQRFTAADIQQIVNTRDVFVFPQANPDGRHHSMTVDPMWRKNRRPAPAGAPVDPHCVGVDINRNYDFLWNYSAHFDPAAPVANSTSPCHPEVYIGPSVASEPETQNVVWILDHVPNIRFFIDLHSFGEDILYSWGDDEDQSTNPDMNFRNPAYDRRRGSKGDTAYREYIAQSDRELAIRLANGIRDAIRTVRGRTYTVQPSFALYPTAGASDDYAYSRHLVDHNKPKVLSYTIEWGSPNTLTPFHPSYSEMQNIIQEVTAGLLAFCLQVT
jgi:murein tripeptide amidase MpaA